MDPLFKIVEVEINSHCNLSCSYCPNNQHQRLEKGIMKLEDYKLILKQLQEAGFKRGRISHEFYGEPLLHPEYEKIIELTRQALPLVKIELYTNATKLTRQRMNHLIELGLDEFIVTKQEQCQNLAFEKEMKFMNEKELSHIKFRTHDQMYKTNRGGILEHLELETQNLMPCQIPSFLLTITVAGNVLPCFEHFYQNHIMGNVFEENLIDIWNGQKFKSFRRDLARGLRHNYEACAGCSRIQTKIPDL